MPDSVSIREASSAEEIADAAMLFREYAASFGWNLEEAGPMGADMLAPPGPYAPPRGSLLLAYVGGEPAAVLGLQPVPEDVRMPGVDTHRFGELKRLYVRPRFRRRGLARMLMERVEAEARDRGYEALVLTTAPELMPLAQSLYDDLGYETTEPYRTDMTWPNIRWLRKG